MEVLRSGSIKAGHSLENAPLHPQEGEKRRQAVCVEISYLCFDGDSSHSIASNVHHALSHQVCIKKSA